MSSLLINIINCVFLLYVIIHYLSKRIDASIIWFAIISIYFINFPLLFDSFISLYYGIFKANRILNENGNNWDIGYWGVLKKISVHSLVFNICFCVTFRIFSNRKMTSYRFPDLSQKNIFFSWKTYLFLSYISFFLFLYHYGITSIAQLGTGLWYQNSSNNRFLNLLVNILIPISSVSALVMLSKKQYLIGIITLIPVLLVGYITGARSQIISSVFYVLYFFLIKYSAHVNLKTILKIIVLGLLAVYAMSFFRSDNFYNYPVCKDISYEDLFYSYVNSHSFTTNGTNTLRLILTGFYDYQAEDVTSVLAGYKYFEGWGTLHPTLLGWAYIDLQNLFWLLAIYLGAFISLCDRLRHKLPSKYNILFLSFIFSFYAIGIRGSVQFAYAIIIYPAIIFFILFVLLNIKNHANLIKS